MTPRQVQILTVLGVAAAVLIAVLVTVLVVGWGDPEAAPTSPAAPATTSTPSPTTAPTSTTTSTPTTTSSSATSTTRTTSTTTTTLPPVACPGPGVGTLPSDDHALASSTGDLDGDGAADRLLIHRSFSPTRFLAVELSYGFTAQTAVAPDQEMAVRSVNLGGPPDLALTERRYSATYREVIFYRFADCRLEAVRLGPEAIAAFDAGADEGGIGGVMCTADGILVTSGSHGDAGYEVSSVTYRWDPETGELTAILDPVADHDEIYDQVGLDC